MLQNINTHLLILFYSYDIKAMLNDNREAKIYCFPVKEEHCYPSWPCGYSGQVERIEYKLRRVDFIFPLSKKFTLKSPLI